MSDRKRILDADGPVKSIYIKDAVDDDKIVLNRVQDVKPVFDKNRIERNEGQNNGYSESRDIQKVASIPMVVIEQWLKEGIDLFNPDHADAVKKKLNDPFYAHLRTSTGQV